MKISVVIPVYQSQRIVDELVRKLNEALSAYEGAFEIILVEDGSNDRSWELIAENCRKFSHVRGIKLSRNFGQHYAITAGIAKAKGDTIVLMDCDLQDDPERINKLIKEREKGFDIVFTSRKGRQHGMVKRLYSFIYNKLFVVFSDKKYDLSAGSLMAFSRQVADVFLQLKDKDRLYLQMFKWLGFNTTTIEVEHKPRFEGKSSYSFMKLVALGVAGWTSHSLKLLRISIYLGFTLSCFSFLAGCYVFVRYLFYDLQPGWPSLILSILFSTGLILLSIGILGIYIGKIFEQVKGRPLYIIEKELGNEQ
jgi:dolichol-phosphate mannosyltransferase